MRLGAVIVALVVAAGAASWWIKFEHKPPTASLDTHGDVVGRRASWDVDVAAPGWPGLRRIEVALTAGSGIYQLLAKDYPASSWIGSGVSQDRVRIEADLSPLGVKEGTGFLRITAETYAWHILTPRQRTVAEKEVRIDLTPPSIELLTTQHNVRVGGSSLAVFRLGGDATEAGIEVGDYFFPAIRGYFADPTIALAPFAVPQDLSSAVRPRIQISDVVGNSRSVLLPCHIRDRKFPERGFEITDDFLTRKVPELMEINRLPEQGDLVQGYLYINRELRADTERRLRAIIGETQPKPLWTGAFRRQSSAATMSFFADRRVYAHAGEIIDRQTHLGVDLASVAGATIEASQGGIVVFAGNLGIYGETVVIDHGLGISSLYGHLRAITVTKGQTVTAGEGIGQSGESGLAGGDHLHFSILVHGVQVDPVEWWDPKWLRDHITSQLAMFPVGGAMPSGDEKKDEKAKS